VVLAVRVVVQEKLPLTLLVGLPVVAVPVVVVTLYRRYIHKKCVVFGRLTGEEKR
jgi:cell division protein FtsL